MYRVKSKMENSWGRSIGISHSSVVIQCKSGKIIKFDAFTKVGTDLLDTNKEVLPEFKVSDYKKIKEFKARTGISISDIKTFTKSYVS